MIEQDILKYLHILLMGYWLGCDLGVYLCADRVADRTKPLDERLNLLKLAMVLDMGPRSALILMLPTGFHMAQNIGLIDGFPIIIIWIASLIWLALAWGVYIKEHTPIGETFRKVDMMVRYGVLVILAAVLITQTGSLMEIDSLWLLVKWGLFATIMVLGLLLRISIKPWGPAFMDLKTNGPSDQANDMITAARSQASKQALLLWALVAISGFIGATKLI